MTLNRILDKSATGKELSREELIYMLKIEDRRELDRLFAHAYSVKEKYVGRKAYFRGIIEFSNICSKDCFYCGLRKSSRKEKQYRMTRDEIVDAAMWAFEQRYGSIVMQSGEIQSDEFTEFVAETVQEIKNRSKGRLGITLCLGEQTDEVYRRWFKAGAHRYLLRIEATDKKLYEKIHPKDSKHDFETRKNCLKLLQKNGYQTGTGVMTGLPFQTPENLANDIIFFRDMNIDMLGMGPYIVHKNTPLAAEMPDFEKRKEKQLMLGLKMIAACRIFLKDVNIAATTALQALHESGRKMGLRAGANVIMPNITKTEYRAAYLLYEDKPAINENSSESRDSLEKNIISAGETVAYDEWGDSPHFFSRMNKS